MRPRYFAFLAYSRMRSRVSSGVPRLFWFAGVAAKDFRVNELDQEREIPDRRASDLYI
jgi:hypothetical protein